MWHEGNSCRGTANRRRCRLFGYNFLASEGLLLGIQGSGLIYLNGNGDTEFVVHGKIGGTFDDVAIYALGGIGVYNSNLPLWDVGVEVAVTDSLAWNAQISGRNQIGQVPNVLHVQTGLRFHF